MPGVCTHEFFWPLRAADGRYYQVCRRCGVTVRIRLDDHGARGWRARSDACPAVSGPNSSARPEIQPQLNLLVELEPAYRVFLRNLADVLRPASPGEPTIWSAAFWREAFFDSGIPWQRFAETLVGQLVVLAMVLLVSQVWITQEQPRRRSMFENTHLTYYKPDGSFPALRSSPPRVRRVPEAGRVRASRLDSRGARTRPGGRQSARPQTEGTRATQYRGFERCASGDAARGCRRCLRDWPRAQDLTSIVAPAPEVSQGDVSPAGSAASFRRRPGSRAWDGFLEASGDCARYGGCCPAASCAGASTQRWGHQHRRDRSGRARAPVAGGRTTPDFGSAPVSDWEPGRMGCSASAYGSAFRNTRRVGARDRFLASGPVSCRLRRRFRM